MYRTFKALAITLCIIFLVSGVSSALSLTKMPATNERIEPTWHHSYICAKSGPDIEDAWLANKIFGKHTNYHSMVFALGECFSGGFVNDLGYKNPNGPRTTDNARSNVAIATGSEYFERCWAGGSPERSRFLKPWQEGVAGIENTMKKAYTKARDEDRNGPNGINKNWTNPQYHSADMDNVQLHSASDKNYAILFAGKANLTDDRNEIERIYDTLIDTYHYNEGDIYVHFGDGTETLLYHRGQAGEKIISTNRKKGIQSELSTTIDNLSITGGNDQLFFWAYDHGDQNKRDLPASFAVEKAKPETPDKGNKPGDFEGHPTGNGDYSKVFDQSVNDNAIGDVFLGKNFKNEQTYDEHALGLTTEQIDAISPGNDRLGKSVWFSVENKPGDEGKANTAVRLQSDRGEHPGDIYYSNANNTNSLVMEESELGLFSRLVSSEGIAPESKKDTLDDDNLFALEFTDPFSPGQTIYFSILGDPEYHIYWSTGNGSKDILEWTDGSKKEDLCTFAHFGISMSDDIDAMALNVGTDHLFDKGIDWILFSLTPDNPWGYSGADLFLSYGDSGFSKYITAAELGLEYDDNIDALDTVPEPATILLLSIGLLGLLSIVRYKKKPMNITVL